MKRTIILKMKHFQTSKSHFLRFAVFTGIMILFITAIYAADSLKSNDLIKELVNKEKVIIENNVKDGNIEYKYKITTDPKDISKGDDKYKCIGGCD